VDEEDDYADNICLLIFAVFGNEIPFFFFSLLLFTVKSLFKDFV
jgi:hypothetical protein